MRLLAVGWLPQSGFAFFTDLANFQRFLDPLHAVGTVIKPGERPDPVEFFALECLACGVKREPAQQNLIGLAKGLHPSTSIDLQAKEILGFAGPPSCSSIQTSPTWIPIRSNTSRPTSTESARSRA
jgi:hypothetical protein